VHECVIGSPLCTMVPRFGRRSQRPSSRWPGG